jgi:hypothetical protein
MRAMLRKSLGYCEPNQLLSEASKITLLSILSSLFASLPHSALLLLTKLY